MLAGCTHTRPLDASAELRRAEVNERATRSSATLTLVTGERVSGRALHLAPDLATWVDPATGEARSAPTGDVAAVEFVGRGRGALQGLGLGLAIGAGVGAAAGWATYEDGDRRPGEWCIIVCSRGDAALFLGSFGGIVGSGVGFLAGLLRGSRSVYEFPLEAPGSGTPAASQRRGGSGSCSEASLRWRPSDTSRCWNARGRHGEGKGSPVDRTR